MSSWHETIYHRVCLCLSGWSETPVLKWVYCLSLLEFWNQRNSQLGWANSSVKVFPLFRGAHLDLLEQWSLPKVNWLWSTSIFTLFQSSLSEGCSESWLLPWQITTPCWHSQRCLLLPSHSKIKWVISTSPAWKNQWNSIKRTYEWLLSMHQMGSKPAY